MQKINYKKIGGFVVSLCLLAMVLLPVVMVYAGPPVDGSKSNTTIENPLGAGNDSVEALMLKIMTLVVTVGAIVVVFFIIYSGYLFVKARGNPTEIEKAKSTFFATVIGATILLGADIIANVVINTVNTIKN